MGTPHQRATVLLLVHALATACGDNDGASPDAGGAVTQVVWRDLPGALLSVWGTSARDVWTVGSDPDQYRPTVLHLDDERWQMVDVGSTGDLWWVFGTGGSIYLGGAGGRILVSDDGETFDSMPTPSTTPIVFGIWGCSPDDLWAVGGNQGGSMGAFAWHLEGGEWVVPDSFPPELVATDAIWKVAGSGCDDVWMVGTGGLAVHWDGDRFGAPLRIAGESLFTDAAAGDLTIAVGGFGTGDIYQHDGESWGENLAPTGAAPLIGVCTGGGAWYASGWNASVLERGADGSWSPIEGGVLLDAALHGCWVDPDGGLWAVGGDVFSPRPSRGVMIHVGEWVPAGTNERSER